MVNIFYSCIILFALGLSLRVSLRLLYGARGPLVDDPIHQMMSVTSTILTLTPSIVFLFVATNWFGFVLLIIAAFAGIELLRARRAMQRQAVWGMVSGEFTGQLPSSTSLWHHQNRFTGIVGRAFRRLVTEIDQGTDLRSAIGLHRKALPDEAQAYAAIDALASLDTPATDEKGEDDQHLSNHWNYVELHMADTTRQLYQRITYLGTVLFVMMSILTFVMIKIVPSFVLIFEDFDLQLPRATILLISVSEGFVGSAISAVFLLGFFLAMFFCFAVVLFYLCDMPVLSPISDRLFFTKHRAFVLRLLAIAAERGQPFSQAIQQLAEQRPWYPSSYVRRRLARVNREIALGNDWKVALNHNSFIKTADFPMLETAQNVGNLPWVLRTLASQKLRTMIFRWTAFEQIAFPCTVILIGLLVMWVSVALFIPIVELINGLV